ncbi:MAG: hypothetical protein KDB61_01005 [Planctomycetes bacterium]|nr:hypothetical protein [Planctomycetota bacterium]
MFQSLKLTPILLTAALAFSGCAQEAPTTPPAHPAGTRAAKKPVAQAPKKEKGTVHASGSELIYMLAPKDTVVWLEVKSFDSLVEAMQGTVGDSLKALGGPADAKGALTLLQLLGVPANKLQTDQPMAVALSLELGSKEPNFTLILPMADSQNTAQALQETAADMVVTARGRFVAMSNSPNYRPDITLASNLEKVRGTELLGVHVETARLVDRFETELDASLEAMRTQASDAKDKTAAQLAGSMVAVETLGALAKGIKDLSVRIDLDGQEVTVETTANLRTGSRLTDFGMDESVDLREMLRHVNATEDEWIVGSAHKEALRFLGEPLVALYDKHAITQESKGVDDQFERWMEWISAPQVNLAITGKLAPKQTDLALFLDGVQGDRWIGQAERLVESNLVDLDQLTLMQPRKGQDDTSRFAQYDLVAQAQTPMATRLESILGSPRVRLRFLGHGDETMLTLGEGAHFQKRDAAPEGQTSPDLAWAFDRVKNLSPALVAHTHSEHGDLEALLGATATPKGEGEPSWVTSYMAFGSTQWRMGARFQIGEFSQAMAQTPLLQGANLLGRP